MTDEAKAPEIQGEQQPDNRLPRTQEEFDAVIQSRHNRDMKKFADYDELKAKAAEYEKQKQAAMTESEKKDARIKELEGTNADLTNQLTDREAKVLRVQMLEAEGLPTSWAERVRGTTPEDIKADVVELKKLLGVKKQPVGGSAAPAESGGPPDMNTLIRGKLGL
jgi:chromosome segregation ATPase